MTEPVAQASGNLSYYRVKADEMKNASNAANKTVHLATRQAKQAFEKVNEVIKKLFDLLEQIENLKTINESEITELENAIKKFTIFNSSREMDDFKAVIETEKVIKRSIVNYTLDLERLKREIAWAKSVYQNLPQICPKNLVCGEGAACKR